EHGGDPEEPAFDAGLSRASVVRLRIRECERGEARICLEELCVFVVEPTLAAVADAEDALDCIAPAHRCDERAAESRIRLARNRIFDRPVLVGGDRASFSQRMTGEAA